MRNRLCVGIIFKKGGRREKRNRERDKEKGEEGGGELFWKEER